MKAMWSLLFSLHILYAQVVQLTQSESKVLISERLQFFIPSINLAYDSNKIQKNSQGLEFMDLCKYPANGYKFACGNTQDEEVGIKKYFIKAESIAKAYKIFHKENELNEIPQNNLYDYGEIESNKDDGVGMYYIWDGEGRFWVIGMGYDSGSITIYTQTKDYIEVIHQWSVDW